MAAPAPISCLHRENRCLLPRRCSRRQTRSQGQRRPSSWASWLALEVCLCYWAWEVAPTGWGMVSLALGTCPAVPAPYRESMSGAGGCDPDQAQRAHRGSAQGRRPGQYHHVSGHSVRDELRHRPVDTLQEVQAYDQCVLSAVSAADPHQTRGQVLLVMLSDLSRYRRMCSTQHMLSTGSWAPAIFFIF